MGFFSWNTSDTGKSIPANGNLADRPAITVYMRDDDGNVFRESDYKGYGEFGGMDYYELVYEMNVGHPSIERFAHLADNERSIGIHLAHNEGNVKLPTLAEDRDFPWSADAAPSSCIYQGFFYD